MNILLLILQVSVIASITLVVVSGSLLLVVMSVQALIDMVRELIKGVSK